jgi:hypothetical protein
MRDRRDRHESVRLDMPEEREEIVVENVDDVLMLLKGFTFDGDTGRTIRDLHAAIDGTGCTRDAPFAGHLRLKGHDMPLGVYSYLEPDGRRVHIIWRSDESGLSQVADVVFDAPSLAREKHDGEAWDVCSIDMMREMLRGGAGEEQ